MTNYMYVLSSVFLVGCLGLALKPSPIYGGLVLILSGCVGCFLVLGLGGSFLGLMVFLIYLGGMMVVFGYTTAMATEEYPETWGSSWLSVGVLVWGLAVEVVVMYVIGYYGDLGLGVEVYGMDSWAVYETDDLGVMGEGGVGVAAMYSCASWLMIVAGWSLFIGVFIIIEITRDN
uniref:NADH dehydrogenase subunit 6 n=1 Tax=Acomys mullah TaxID=2866131 RepID=UPI002176D8D5|nr:NADH dehydrogenase subunit 6 [Acomys mullah]UUA62912.1 NADH dehydrogenase subunit 6 [Acomys mullah]